MITISVNKFSDALTLAPVYKHPEMNAGAQYLYDKMFDCHITGVAPKLSKINFDAFNLDDIDDFLTFISDTDRHAGEVKKVAETFNKLKPAVVAGTFI